MIFGNRKPNPCISIKINNEAINRVEVRRNLNFLIDSRGMHILYHSLSLLYIMQAYRTEVWGNTYATNVKLLFFFTEKGSKVKVWCKI